MKEYMKMSDVFGCNCYTPPLYFGEVHCNEVKIGKFEDRKIAIACVHAINSHDELVQMNKEMLAALELSVQLMDHFGEAYGCVTSNYIEYKAAIAAIAKAKGGAA